MDHIKIYQVDTYGFSSPRAFRTWSRNCRSPFGSFGNTVFVCVCILGEQSSCSKFWIPTRRRFNEQNRHKVSLHHYQSFDRHICHVKLCNSNLSDKHIRISRIQTDFFNSVIFWNVPWFMCFLRQCCVNISPCGPVNACQGCYVFEGFHVEHYFPTWRK